jgi:energy-coupling factor transport system substrate-specific component
VEDHVDWLTICAPDQTEGCVQSIQLVYLVAVLVGTVLFALIARRSRDLPTAVLTLMPVAIAINVAVGSIAVALRLPIYLDSIGTVLVGVVAGPWAGALTGLLSNLIWSVLPIPGGAGPTAAFFAPVAGVIGLMAGFWADRGVFRLRADDARVGGFLALAGGIAAAAIAFFVIGLTVGIPDLGVEDADQLLANQTRFVLTALGAVLVGVVVAYLSRRTVFRLDGQPERARQYLVAASAIAAGTFTFLFFRLLFGPTGYFSGLDGSDPDGPEGPLGPLFGGANLTGLAVPDPTGLIVAAILAVVVGLLVARWASSNDHARLFPVWVGGLTTGLVAAAISAPISAGVFGGVTGGGTDALIALFRTLGLNVFQSAFAQGLTSDPLDKTISYTVVFVILGALPITMRTMFSRGEATVAE